MKKGVVKTTDISYWELKIANAMKPYDIYKIAIQEEKFRRAIEALDEIMANGRDFISSEENVAIRSARESIRNARNRNAENFEQIEKMTQ